MSGFFAPPPCQRQVSWTSRIFANASYGTGFLTAEVKACLVQKWCKIKMPT